MQVFMNRSTCGKTRMHRMLFMSTGQCGQNGIRISRPANLVLIFLMNLPYIEDMNDQYAKKGPVPGEIYRKVAEGASKAIWKANKDRLIVADGNSGGSNVIPELTDLNIAQSCRAYYPHYVSHYQASWVWKDPSQAPMPVWPGTIDGKQFGRTQLEEFYKPWIELSQKGSRCPLR